MNNQPAEKTAEQMANEAIASVRRIRYEAYAMGYKKGFEAGVAAATTEQIEPSKFLA